MKIIIIGASSYVGARLYFDLRSEHEVIGTYFSNKLSDDFIFLDVTDRKSVIRLIKTQKVDIIIHVANNASWLWCENHPREALEINQNATKFIVKAAIDNGAKLIYISSFAATANTLYGHTKKYSEDIIINSKARYCIIRPSLIIGLSPNKINDRPFNKILKNIDAGIPAVYDSSWRFQPTLISHLSAVIRDVIGRDIHSCVINVACPEVISRYKLAKDILTPLGIGVTETILHSDVIMEKHSLLMLKELQLPISNYSDSVREIIHDIKHRNRFLL